MLFSSVFFLFVFLPVTLLLYYLVPWKFKNTLLLLVSLVFYAWGEPVYVFLMLFSILFNFLGGLQIDSLKKEGNQKMLKISFWFTIVVNLVMLGFFKYAGFIVESINAILPVTIPYKGVALPIGISFYTFQTMSYVIDLYKGNTAVQKNFISFGAYVTMFPQLIAGPIVRYQDIEEQLQERTLSMYKFGQGMAWFLRGLAKKVLLANNMGSVFDAIYALGASERSVLTAWIGCLAYTMQIYFDFSGYSDMAVGLGKMLGFEFVQNFDYPYTSKSLTEFWRRWHISLGTWFREYVYIPLGGNRVSNGRQIMNIMIVWALTGLWHGAAWNFVFWGLYHGIILLIEKKVLKKLLDKLPGFVRVLYTVLIVMIGWVMFFSTSLSDLGAYLGNMFGAGGSGFADSTGLYYLATNAVLILLCIAFSGPGPFKKLQKIFLKPGKARQVAAVTAYIALFVLSVAYLVNATYNPFLYFRF